MRTLTAIRLVIASRLGIEDEDDRDEDDPRFGVYDWLGYRLEGLHAGVRAVIRDGPADGVRTGHGMAKTCVACSAGSSRRRWRSSCSAHRSQCGRKASPSRASARRLREAGRRLEQHPDVGEARRRPG